ncbi:MAG: hypothetical protein WC408_04165 [Candidatus Micrarchaeia archaeon]|jgi:hypothetical protein
MIEYVLCILCGGLVKLADEYADRRNFQKHELLGFAAGIGYGILGAILVTWSPVIATACLAVIIAVVFAGKEDHPIHYCAMFSFLLVALYLGFKQPYAIPLFVLVAAAFIDERMSDRAELGKIRNKNLRKFFSARLMLDVTAIAVSIALAEPVYALAVVGFDAGYQAVAYVTKSTE